MELGGDLGAEEVLRWDDLRFVGWGGRWVLRGLAVD